MEIPSRLLQSAVDQFSTLPGIGQRTATRLALHLLRQDKMAVRAFGEAMIRLRDEIQFCETCHNISETPKCEICASPRRENGQVCVVEDIRDVLAFEKTQQFFGRYHVLGGVISPMDGIGPQMLNVDSLIERAQTDEIKEIILAISTTMEGDTTNYFIFKKLEPIDVKVSIIARGVAVGDALEYTDEITLGRSLQGRIPFEQTFSH